MAETDTAAPRTLPPALDLTGRRALVTGGSRGIGKAIAMLLAARGAAVAVNYARNDAAAKEVCDAIAAAGGRAIPIGFDVGDESQVNAAFKQIVQDLGGLEILVNNAGISIDGLLLRIGIEDWDQISRTNLRGTLLCSKAAARHMILKAREKGRIINLASVVGEQGNAGQTMYAATKAGIIGMTKAMARELASRRVTVNAVAPGFIDTDMTESALQGDAREALIKQIPLGRVGAANDVAETVAFLASDASAYITGHVMRVNGGLLI